jgi:hypothetical protein
MAIPTMSAPAPPVHGRTPDKHADWPAVRSMSVLILTLMLGQSVGGLWIPGVYRDPPPVVAMLRGYDVVTLLVVVPALGLSVLAPWRRTRGARLVWLSMLAYGVYTYAFYVFATAFNALFLVHVALFGLCVFTLAIGLSTVDVAGIATGFHARTPVRAVGGLLIVLAASLAGMWIVNAVGFAVTGTVPRDNYLVAPVTVVHLGYVLDLALYAPACAVAGTLLWRRRPWGYLLAAVMLVFGTVFQLCYLSALAFQAAADIPGAAFDPAEPVILAVLAAATAVLLAGLRPRRVPR